MIALTSRPTAAHWVRAAERALIDESAYRLSGNSALADCRRADALFCRRVACSLDDGTKERDRRLNDHGAAFCRQVLSGAFRPVYSDDGKHLAYRDMHGNLYTPDLRPIPVMGEVA